MNFISIGTCTSCFQKKEKILYKKSNIYDNRDLLDFSLYALVHFGKKWEAFICVCLHVAAQDVILKAPVTCDQNKRFYMSQRPSQ